MIEEKLCGSIGASDEMYYSAALAFLSSLHQ